MKFRRTMTALGGAALAGAVLALTPGPAGGQAEPCEQPYSPVAFAEAYPAQEELPAVPGDVVSSPVDLRDQAFDSDGDGVDDTVAQVGDTVVITRGDGVVTLTSDSPVYVGLVGDLDGDGREELGATTGTAGAVRTYLLPGTTPPGTSALADAGIRMADGTFVMRAVGDGSDRLLAYVAPTNSVVEGRTDILPASTVLAAGPGGDASGVTGLTTPGRVTAVADLGGPELALISGRASIGGPQAVELFIWDGDEGPGVEPTTLTTAPEPYFPNEGDAVGGVEVVVGSAGTFVTLGQSSRSGAAAYLWSLDDPCTPYAGDEDSTTTSTSTSTPTAPTAPPAQPVRANARFTG